MAFDTSVSGILSASADLGIIGNNIANASTTGFRSRGRNSPTFMQQAFLVQRHFDWPGREAEFSDPGLAQGNIEFTNNSLDPLSTVMAFFA